MQDTARTPGTDAPWPARTVATPDIRQHRSADFAALMFDALDNAFCALGHPDPIDYLRRVAKRRQGSGTADEGAGAVRSVAQDGLSIDFAADILITASHYAALLKASGTEGCLCPQPRLLAGESVTA